MSLGSNSRWHLQLLCLWPRFSGSVYFGKTMAAMAVDRKKAMILGGFFGLSSCFIEHHWEHQPIGIGCWKLYILFFLGGFFDGPSIGNCRRLPKPPGWISSQNLNLSRCQVDQAVKCSVFAQCQGGGMVQTSTLPFLHGGFLLVTPQYPSGRVPKST